MSKKVPAFELDRDAMRLIEKPQLYIKGHAWGKSSNFVAANIGITPSQFEQKWHRICAKPVPAKV